MNSFDELFCNDNARRFAGNNYLISVTYNCLRGIDMNLDTYFWEIKFHFLVGIYVVVEKGTRWKGAHLHGAVQNQLCEFIG